MAKIEWKKIPYIFFFYFLFKNKRVWAEKIRKKQKNSKNLKVAGNSPNIYFTQYLKKFTWKIKIINFYYSNYWGSEVVGGSCYPKIISAPNLLIYMYLHCVRRLSWSATTLDTLISIRLRKKIRLKTQTLQLVPLLRILSSWECTKRVFKWPFWLRLPKFN